MYHFHDRTRRWVCFVAFLFSCVLPALIILLCGVFWHWPGYVSAEAKRLSCQLGLDVSLDGVKYLRPGLARYEGLQLSDPETHQSLLRCRALEAQFSRLPDAEGRRKPSLKLTAWQPEIQAGAAGRLWQLVAEPLELRGELADLDLCLSAATDLILNSPQSAITLADVQGSIERLTDGSQALLSFRLAETGTAQPTRIRVVRNRQVTPPACGFEVDTGGGAVPCALLALGVAELKCLGPDARFNGFLWANQSAGGEEPLWDGEVAGQFTEIDLDRLVSERYPHKLSGTAQLNNLSARFQQGRLETGTCTLTAGPGLIGRSLVDAAAAKLSLSQDARSLPQGNMVRYQQLSLAAFLDSGGLRLQGRCASSAPGTILSDGRNRLLGEPTVFSQPVAALLQMLVPQSDVQVPAARQTEWLAGHLPVSRAVSPQSPESTARNPRLRLDGTAEK
jgi:hypothetical protein